jgi:hypothetical protein
MQQVSTGFDAFVTDKSRIATDQLPVIVPVLWQNWHRPSEIFKFVIKGDHHLLSCSRLDFKALSDSAQSETSDNWRVTE